MKTKQLYFKDGKIAAGTALAPLAALNPQLVIAFGADEVFAAGKIAAELKTAFPTALIVGGSTAGEITDDGVRGAGLVVTAVRFERFSSSGLKAVSEKLLGMAESQVCGAALGKKLLAAGPHEQLRSVLIFGQGVDINGSGLIDGLQSVIGKNVLITGGLAADGGKFQRTYTLLGGQVSDRDVVAVGVFGDGLQIGFGSMGGWEPFGPVRRVTKAKDNVLFELDGKPALGIYREYLGEQAKGLPATGLLFPFAILQTNQDTTGIIRTILGIDDAQGSLTLAGDIPQNGMVRLMHSRSDSLVEGALGAARASRETRGDSREPESLAILVSCIGRKLVMGDDADDEIDAVREVLGKGATITGFYSNGEICPQFKVADCKLHNQTMTITYVSEK